MTLKEIIKLFREKSQREFVKNEHGYDEIQWLKIEQFWLEHTRALLESVKLETKKINPCDNCYNKDQMADKRCMNCQYDAGWNLRNLLLNTKIQFLLSEGERMIK